ncbi:hypothetical protein Y1Q_0007537 [Alligator mississippiensis]|uniref:Uncharacterized protein n=1 Tax=Alligator mississippiensis TaxID=8496 RepID=A0A151M529_ALLMI|nr:hypothetical protein Y1Q_0007537 [Alligator mississippiensis]
MRRKSGIHCQQKKTVAVILWVRRPCQSRAGPALSPERRVHRPDPTRVAGDRNGHQLYLSPTQRKHLVLRGCLVTFQSSNCTAFFQTKKKEPKPA